MRKDEWSPDQQAVATVKVTGFCGSATCDKNHSTKDVGRLEIKRDSLMHTFTGVHSFLIDPCKIKLFMISYI